MCQISLSWTCFQNLRIFLQKLLCLFLRSFLQIFVHFSTILHYIFVTTNLYYIFLLQSFFQILLLQSFFHILFYNLSNILFTTIFMAYYLLQPLLYILSKKSYLQYFFNSFVCSFLQPLILSFLQFSYILCYIFPTIFLTII